jgi:hypothetical protein
MTSMSIFYSLLLSSREPIIVYFHAHSLSNLVYQLIKSQPISAGTSAAVLERLLHIILYCNIILRLPTN